MDTTYDLEKNSANFIYWLHLKQIWSKMNKPNEASATIDIYLLKGIRWKSSKPDIIHMK